MAGTLTTVGTASDGKGSSRLPAEQAASVARAVEKAIAERYKGKSERVIAAALGITQPALNKIRRCDGALGVNTLITLRESLRVSIDELLGLGDLEKRAVAPEPPPIATLSPALLDQIRSLLREEMAARPTEPESPPSAPTPPRSGAPRSR